MNYRIIENQNHTILEALGQGDVIGGEADALDWVGLCGETRTNLLLLDVDSLSPDFYCLSTKIAGGILLKFSNYRIKVAALSTPERVGDGKFRDMALETNRGSAFRIFYDRQQALDWLSKD